MNDNSSFARVADHQGDVFYSALRCAHVTLDPSCYLEIGTATGASLALASCKSIAIDPGFEITENITGSKPCCLLFQTTSDDFFGSYNPEVLLGSKVDMAFLDGMHHFEFLLRDFYNVEKYCREDSFMFLHDCIPTDSHVARRDSHDLSTSDMSEHPSWWAGDLWKLVLILKKFRPELKILAFDAPPTGLIAVTNLNPRSSLLQDRYQEIVPEYLQADFNQDFLDRFISSLDIRSTKSIEMLVKTSNRLTF